MKILHDTWIYNVSKDSVHQIITINTMLYQYVNNIYIMVSIRNIPYTFE